jgi:NAD(P)H-hydrate epimerase
MSDDATPTALPTLPARNATAHKGTSGTVVIVAGSYSPRAFMPGAAVLASRGALRAGAGLARVVCPLAIAGLVVQALPSATVCAFATDSEGNASASDAAAAFDDACAGASTMVVGCGLGRSEHARALVYRALSFVGSTLPGQGAVAQHDVPLVLDADGIRLLAEMRVSASEVRRPLILTPHPGEFAALAASLQIDFDAGDTRDGSRVACAEQAAQRLGCIVVLKGHRSVVTNGYESWVCDAGHPCMATAGTGDVLAGVLGGLLAQRTELARRSKPNASKGTLDDDELASLRALALAKLGKLAAHAQPPASESAQTSKADTALHAPAPPSLLDCVKLGVLAHARAGEAWAQATLASAGLLATELADGIPVQLEQLRTR